MTSSETILYEGFKENLSAKSFSVAPRDSLEKKTFTKILKSLKDKSLLDFSVSFNGIKIILSKYGTLNILDIKYWS